MTKDKSTNEDPAESFLAKVKERLDSVPSMFVKPRFLCDIGIFGSYSAAVHAVKKGAFAHVKVSPYRILIQKEDVLSFIKERHHEQNQA